MSTRCVVNFCEGGQVVAKVYQHSDGYPGGEGYDGVLVELEEFFTEVEKQAQDSRFADPAYLAAKFVVWLSGTFARDPGKPLAFLGVGVLMTDPGDIEYRYFLYCDHYRLVEGRPKVIYEERYGTEWRAPQ